MTTRADQIKSILQSSHQNALALVDELAASLAAAQQSYAESQQQLVATQEQLMERNSQMIARNDDLAVANKLIAELQAEKSAGAKAQVKPTAKKR